MTRDSEAGVGRGSVEKGALGPHSGPSQQLRANGQDTARAVGEALRVLQERPNRDPVTGQFIVGNTDAGVTLERSSAFWSAVAEAKRELVERLRADLTLGDNAATTLEGLADAYSEGPTAATFDVHAAGRDGWTDYHEGEDSGAIHFLPGGARPRGATGHDSRPEAACEAGADPGRITWRNGRPRPRPPKGATMPHDLSGGEGASAPLDILTFWDEVLSPSVPLLQRDTWEAWEVALKALFALPMDEADFDLYRAGTGRTHYPREPAREVWFIVGRRGGKSYVMALLAVYFATVRTYDLAPGERGVLMVIASDRRQARVVRRYIGALLEAVPMLNQMGVKETKETIQLSNGIDVEIHTASFRSVRGYSVVGAVWMRSRSGRPRMPPTRDREVLKALRPAMSTTGGMLVAISSPYARRGALYEVHKKHYGQDSDVLVWNSDTATMNPTINPAIIDRAFEEDPVAAASEYGRDGARQVSIRCRDLCVSRGHRGRRGAGPP